MKAQCPCVVGSERTPNPDCKKCRGSGFIEVTFPEEENIEALWIGRCPLCGASNGCHIQQKGKPTPISDPYWKCVNENCERPHVELVNIKTVTEWYAVCPICSTIHYADFLQRACDDPPTTETHPRTCLNPNCESQMMWVLGKEVCDNLDL